MEVNAETLRRIRDNKGLSQKEFALFLGISERSYQNYEAGKTGPGKWYRQLDSRRAVFTTRYRKLKKEMGIPAEYTVYSFRHSAITKLYKNLCKEHPKEMALTLTAEITGHTSKAIQAYIHYIDGKLPEDYSKYLK